MRSNESTLREIKFSLNEERGMSFFTLLKTHHNAIRQCIPTLIDGTTSIEDKQQTLPLFFKLFRMHAKAEEETLYLSLKEADLQEARLEGLVGQDEHDLVLELFDDLTKMGYESQWSVEIDAKIKVLTELIKGHLRQEENEIFAIAQKALGEDVIESLVDKYVDKCETYLNIDLKIVPDNAAVDMRVLFY